MNLPSVLSGSLPPYPPQMRNGGPPPSNQASYGSYSANAFNNPEILSSAGTRTGNPIGRPSNTLLAARNAAPDSVGQQHTPGHNSRNLPRGPGTRGSVTPVPAHMSQAPPPTMRVFYRAPTFPEGPLALYAPPPGQPTMDATLSKPARSQAMYSTYPSRMRTGVTSLVQPELITGGPRERAAFLEEYEREMQGMGGGKPGSGVSTPRLNSPAPRATFRPTITGRRGRAVNYVDKGSDEDSDSSLSDIGSDPEDDNRRVRRKDQPMDIQSAQRIARLKRKKDEMDKGWTWLGDRTPGDKVTSVGVRAIKHKYFSEEQLEEADQAEILIPITLDLDVVGRTPEQGTIKIRDRFLWNVNDTLLDPNVFAATLVADLSIPSENIGIIAELIRTQVEESQSLIHIDIADTEPTEAEINFEEETLERDDTFVGEEEWKEADCRVILNIDLQISTQILRDRIEWDLSSTLPPAVFSAAYTRDLGLAGEATPLIAHAITEEILRHKKDALDLRLFRSSHPDEQAKWEKTTSVARVNNRLGAKELKGVWRDWFEREEYGPILLDLTLEEMEKREVERNREQRRIMRGVIGKRRR